MAWIEFVRKWHRVKKGRHRRFEEARAMKRSHDVDLDALMESLEKERHDNGDPWGDDEDDEDSDD